MKEDLIEITGKIVVAVLFIAFVVIAGALILTPSYLGCC